MLSNTGIVLALFGVLVMGMGVVLWKKQKYTWASRSEHVKRADIGPFSKLIGQATLCFGAAIISVGVLFMLALPMWGILGLAIFLVPGLILYGIAQSRYN
jgi:nitrate reductase gamma subunit